MRRHEWTLVLVMIPAMLMLCRTTRAQGPEDYLLKSEIKMKYLEQYATRLDLSLAQWLAVLEFHLEYKKRYQELRTREIEPWLKDGIDRSPSTFAAALKGDAAFFDKLKYFRRKMAGFDDKLFLAIEPILTETQLERLPQVRDHRQRQFAYLTSAGIARSDWKHGVLDLGEIIYSMTLTGAEENSINLILSEYERRLTPLARQVSEICIDWHTDNIREMVLRGFGEDEFGVHPDWTEVVRYNWTTTNGRRRLRLSTQIDTLTHNTAMAIEQAFVGERREEWLDAYVEAAYSRYTGIRIYRRRVIESLESITILSDEEREFLAGSVLEYERRMRDLLERNMAASDGYWTPRIPGTGEEHSDRWDEARAVWNARHEETYAIRDWFRNQLEQGLGTTAFAEWDQTHTRLSARPDWRPQHTSGQHVRMLYDSPLCITERDVDQVLDRFDLDDETRAAIDTLMEAYQRECRTKETQQLEATNYTDGPLEAKRIERTLRRDSYLIEAIKHSLDSDEAGHMLDWLPRVRHRQQYARNLYGGGEIDPVTFLFDAELTTDQFLELAPHIDAYNIEVNPLYRKRYNSAVRYMREDREEYFKHYRDDEIKALNRRIVEINYQVMRTMTAALPEVLGMKLFDTFLRTTHPFLYKDDSQLHQFFQRPTLREKMAGNQRLQIENLQAEYISRYAELTNAMVALCVDADAWTSGESGVTFNVPTRTGGIIAEYAPLHIQRDDLNAATNVRIRTILTPQQVKAGGGLPELK